MVFGCLKQNKGTKMGTLKNKLSEDLKIALKNQDKDSLGVIRMLISSIQYGQTAAKPIEELDSLLSYRKQLKDSLEMYEKGGEKYLQIEKELTIVEKYVPQAPSNKELENIIKEKVASIPDNEKVNIGLIMKELKQVYPTCDGKTVMSYLQKEVQKRS